MIREGGGQTDFGDFQRKWWRQEFLSGNFDYPLSPDLTEYILAYAQKSTIGINVVELTCGLYPSSDVIPNITNGNRLLVDIVSLEEFYSTRGDTGLLFLQHDLNYSQRLVQSDEYKFQLSKMEDGIDTLVIGSGINYFDWKRNLPFFFQGLRPDGLVFLYTGIFVENEVSPLQQTLDKANRPQAVDEILEFFGKEGFEIEASKSYYSRSGQERVIVCARKKNLA
jgi:hypothetical protein